MPATEEAESIENEAQKILIKVWFWVCCDVIPIGDLCTSKL